MKGDSKPPTKPKRSRRRWLRALGWTVSGLIGLCAVLVLAVLYSSFVTRIAVEQGAAAYSSSIPGDASVTRVEGRLGGDLVLHGVRLEDREGKALVEVDRLRVGVSLRAALVGRLDLGRIEVEGVRVFLPTEDAAGFADLAPPSDDEPPPPDDEGVGPDLPLRIDVELELRDFALVDAASGSVQLSVAVLDIDAWARGRRAEATLRLEGAVPMSDLDDVLLSLHVAWDDPVVRVTDLALRTSWGTVESEGMRLDASTMQGALEATVVEASDSWIEAQLGVEPAAPWRVTLGGEGDPTGVDVEVDVDAPDVLTGSATISGRPTVPLDMVVALRIVPGGALLGELGELGEVFDAGPLELTFTAGLEGDPDEELRAGLALHCPKCDPLGMPLSLVARAQGAPAVPNGRLNAMFVGGGVGLGVEASLDASGAYRAVADLSAPDLRRVAALVGRITEPPDLAGAASARVDCHGTIDPLTASCGVEVGLREGRPVRFVDLAAQVEVADTIEVVAHRLQLDAPPVRLRIAEGTPKVVMNETLVQIDDVDLRVSVDGAVGRVVASGRLDASGEHALDVGVRGLELAGLDGLVPGLGLRGRLDLQAHLAGTTAQPVVDAHVTARNLGWQAHELGTVRAELGYVDGRARVSVRSPTGPLQGVRFDASVPMDVPAGDDPGGLRGHAPARASFQLEGFDLAIAAAFVPEPIALEGRLDLEVTLAGTLAGPRVELTLDGRELALDGAALGDLHAAASYAQSSGRVELELEHPSVRKVRAEVETSLRLDLARPNVAWAPRDVRRAQVMIEGAKLDMLSPWLPEPALDGSLDLDVALTGSLVEPQLDVHLGLQDLDVQGRRVGSLDAALRYADGSAWLQASGRGPTLEGLGITARVPIRLFPATGRVQWAAEAPHEIDVALVGVHLQDVMAWLPEPLDLEGRGDTFIHVRGSATEPTVEASMAFDGLRYGGRAVGRLDLEAAFADERATADLRLRHDATRFVTAQVLVPVRVDGSRGDVSWLHERPHELHVDAPRIEPSLLEPFVELPESLDFALALHVEGRGDLNDPTLDLRIEGDVELEGSPRQPLHTQLSIGGKAQSAKVVFGDPRSPLLSVDGRLELPIEAVARGEAQVNAAPLHIDARADIDLSLAAGLAPELIANPSGRVGLKASVDGTVGTPTLDGRLGMSGAALTVVPLRQRFERLTLDVSLSQQRIELATLTARSGRGSLHASGHVELGQEGVEGQLRLRGRRVPLRKPGLPHMELTTNVLTDLSTRAEQTRIDVDVSDTRVDVSLTQSAAAKSIPTSERVHYVELDHQMDRPLAKREVPDESTAPKEPSGKPMVVDLKLSRPVRITGPAVDMAWSGGVRATIAGGGAEAQGALSTQDGHFDLFGNQFRIEEGSVFIPEGSDGEPFVDLTAMTQVAEVQITAHVRGRVTRPELIFSSTPAMTQSQIFTMLLTGSPDVDSADSGDVEARAASMLAAFSNPALQRQLSDRIGVDRVGVGFGDRTDQPVLSAGKYIGKKIYVESQYKHNAAPIENRAQVMMRYRLAPRWSLETVFGDAAAGGIDLFWGRAFDVRRRRRSTQPPPPTDEGNVEGD
jgi:autotransporter translocation and assembly factor TamB